MYHRRAVKQDPDHTVENGPWGREETKHREAQDSPGDNVKLTGIMSASEKWEVIEGGIL